MTTITLVATELTSADEAVINDAVELVNLVSSLRQGKTALTSKDKRKVRARLDSGLYARMYSGLPATELIPA